MANEITTLHFRTVVRGRLTIHKDRLGISGQKSEMACQLIQETIAEMARPGTGPLAFEHVAVAASEIRFEAEASNGDSLEAHSFIGRLDRDCEKCSQPDRARIHQSLEDRKA